MVTADGHLTPALKWVNLEMVKEGFTYKQIATVLRKSHKIM